MRKLVVGVLATAALVAMAAPAAAAAPEVQQKSCEADNGLFTRDHGVKSCTTTVVQQEFGDIQSQFMRSAGIFTVTYSGSVREFFDVTTTTTRTQKGNGEVTTASTISGQLVSWAWQ